jgi:hypothetical protein
MGNGQRVRSAYEAIKEGDPGPINTTGGGLRDGSLEKLVEPLEVEVDVGGWNGDSADDSRRTYS